jgi:predicted  nucleic acid-binding Zn-ribbon protein
MVDVYHGGPSQTLMDEKNELERALMSVQEMLQNTTNEKEQVTKLFQDFKVHFESIKTQSEGYQKKLVEEMRLRKSQEDMFEVRLQ